MKFFKIICVWLLVIVFLFSSVGITPQSFSASEKQKTKKSLLQQKKKTVKPKIQKIEIPVKQPTLIGGPGGYQDFSLETYQRLLGQKPFALFFHASWCPTCRNMEKEIQENLSQLPQDLTLLKVNFDQETEIKKKYGLTQQSLVKIIDGKGNPGETLVAPKLQKIIEGLRKVQ